MILVNIMTLLIITMQTNHRKRSSCICQHSRIIVSCRNRLKHFPNRILPAQSRAGTQHARGWRAARMRRYHIYIYNIHNNKHNNTDNNLSYNLASCLAASCAKLEATSAIAIAIAIIASYSYSYSYVGAHRCEHFTSSAKGYNRGRREGRKVWRRLLAGIIVYYYYHCTNNLYTYTYLSISLSLYIHVYIYIYRHINKSI